MAVDLPASRPVQRSAALDALRAVAALAVVFGHAGLLAQAAHGPRDGVLGFLARNGWKGVFLFFAISGYLIARPFVRAALGRGCAPRLRDYARRRAARILPAHWLALSVMALVILLDSAAYPQDLTSGRYAAHLLLIQNLVPGVATTILPVTWTLGIEALFYATVPLVYLVATRGGSRRTTVRHLLLGLGLTWAVSGVVLSVAAGIAEVPATAGSVVIDNLISPAVGYLVYFIPGVLVATLEAATDSRSARTVLRWARRSWRGLLALAAAIWVVSGVVVPTSLDGGAEPIGPLTTALQPFVQSLIGGCAVLAVVARGNESWVPRWLLALGESSYGIYLWHWIVINVAFWAASRGGVPVGIWTNQFLDWVISVLLTFPIAWASWRFVERPAMGWARRREVAAHGSGGRRLADSDVLARARPAGVAAD